MVEKIVDLEGKIEEFLKNLESESQFEFKNTVKGNTENGLNLRLGYSCYALKIKYTIGLWDKLENNTKNDWISFLNSFQKKIDKFPTNSFVDDALLKGYDNFSTFQKYKNLLKTSLNRINLLDYKGLDHQLKTAIRAETKQAISSLFQIGSKNKKIYFDFEKDEEDIANFLQNLNWSKPWSSGADYANLCLFNSTQIVDNAEQIKVLRKQIKKYLNVNDGFYYSGNRPQQTQLINGAMKVFSGLKWINSEIHYPQKIIDYCLSTNVNDEGCDLVDTVFVLYEASKQVNYRKNEVVLYMNNIKEIIFSRFYPEYGGFSYYRNQSQKYYYGLVTSNGENYPDIHGTILLTWALSMIFDFSENENYSWKILKP